MSAPVSSRTGVQTLTFYLGTHHPHWLWTPNLPADLPLFVSHRRLVDRTTTGLRRARRPYALDSGGFTELSMFGGWRTTPEQYVTAPRRYVDRLGPADFIAPQDWMCEPFMLAKTGRTVHQHQTLTVTNYVRLRQLAPELNIMPVVQGWQLRDYLRCLDLYAEHGIDLTAQPRVGLGSVCRRQSTTEIADIVAALAEQGLRLHGFGVKAGGLLRYGQHLRSADSLAWSFRARREPRLPGCETHKNCANCMRYAQRWHTNVLHRLGAHPRGQLPLFTAPHRAPTHPRLFWR